MTTWWVTLIIGIGTAAVTILGVVISSGRQQEGLRQQIKADASTAQASQRGQDRAEWFRRVQWAQSLLGQEATQVAGLGLLRVLADDADDADAALISALLDASPAIGESLECGAADEAAGRTEDDESVVYEVRVASTGSSGPEGAPMPEASVKPSSRVVTVSRAQVEAAKLKVDLDKRLAKTTPTIIKKVANAT